MPSMTAFRLTTREVAVAAGCCDELVRKLANNGVLSCERTSGNHRRFPESAIRVVEKHLKQARSPNARQIA